MSRLLNRALTVPMLRSAPTGMMGARAASGGQHRHPATDHLVGEEPPAKGKPASTRGRAGKGDRYPLAHQEDVGKAERTRFYYGFGGGMIAYATVLKVATSLSREEAKA